jgi:hypothetical protein
VESDLTALYLMAAQSLPTATQTESTDLNPTVVASDPPLPLELEDSPSFRKNITPKIVFGKGTRSIQSDRGVPIDLDRGFRLDSKARSTAAKQQLDSYRLDVRQQAPSNVDDSPLLQVPQQSVQPETVVARATETELESLMASRVLIVDIPFLLESDSQTQSQIGAQTEIAPEIPLNWKLAKQQTQWYQTAWENVYRTDLKQLFDKMFADEAP